MTITLTREEAKQVLAVLEYPGLSWADSRKKVAEILCARLAQPEPEPVAWKNEGDMGRTDWKVWAHGKPTATIPLYTAPPQREWQGLTDAEMMDLELSAHDLNSVSIIALRRFGRAVESKLKEKNS